MGVITRDALRARLSRGDEFVLIETLSATSFAHGHIPGAVNLPPADIRRRAAELIPSRDSEIVLYCASQTCDAAARSERVLRSLGYHNILHYYGGKADWKDAGLPLATGSAA